MTSSWKFFTVIEALLLILALYQLWSNIPVLIILFVGIINIVYAIQKKKRTSFNQFQIIGGLAVALVALLNSVAIWFMLVFAVLFIGLKGVEVSGVALFQSSLWKKKHMIIVETTDSEPKNSRRFKRAWFGNQRIGSNIYEWDDINFSIISGDTIIDLGNTLLPKEDNVILIRKGIGRTRILVPIGIGLVLENSTLVGDVVFEETRYHLRNESLKIYSEDYDQNPRRLKIITNTLFGDVEVIRI